MDCVQFFLIFSRDIPGFAAFSPFTQITQNRLAKAQRIARLGHWEWEVKSSKLTISEYARIILGQVAPTPWIAAEAARSLQGKQIDETTADIAGVEAVAGAMALSHNQYKIELAQVAVKRAILRAAGLDTGGL